MFSRSDFFSHERKHTGVASQPGKYMLLFTMVVSLPSPHKDLQKATKQDTCIEVISFLVSLQKHLTKFKKS